MNRVCGYLESGAKEGAEAKVGGKRHGTEGYFVEPTVLVNTHEKMKVVQRRDLRTGGRRHPIRAKR